MSSDLHHIWPENQHVLCREDRSFDLLSSQIIWCLKCSTTVVVSTLKASWAADMVSVTDCGSHSHARRGTGTSCRASICERQPSHLQARVTTSEACMSGQYSNRQLAARHVLPFRGRRGQSCGLCHVPRSYGMVFHLTADPATRGVGTFHGRAAPKGARLLDPGACKSRPRGPQPWPCPERWSRAHRAKQTALSHAW